MPTHTHCACDTRTLLLSHAHTQTSVQRSSLVFEFSVPVRNFHIAVKYMYLRHTEVRVACAVYARSGKFKVSSEPGGKRPYPVDIKWQIVYQRIGMNSQFSDITKRLNIATSTAHRIYQQFDQTGDIQPVHHKSRAELQALHEQNV